MADSQSNLENTIDGVLAVIETLQIQKNNFVN